MFSIAIIIFRESLEIALILGVLLAATRGLKNRSRWVFGGLGLGAVGAGLVAFFAEIISSAAQGMGQELFNASILFFAAGLIGWTVVWMRRCGPTLNKRFKEVGLAVCEGQKPAYTLMIVATLAVLREGSEIVLFIYGAIASGEVLSGILAGSLLGLVSGILVGTVIYYGLIKIPARHLFSVTGTLLIFLAAGMVSQALGFLSAAGYAPEIVSTIWDSSKFLPEHSWFGRVLHALVGYTERPSGVQLLGYLLTLGGLHVLLNKLGNPKKIVSVLLFIIATGLLGFSQDAFATKKVYSPLVVPGEWELEYRGSVAFDNRVDQDDKQRHKFAVGYGVNDFWFTEVYGILENHPGSQEDKGLEYEATEWENRFQLAEPGQWWVDTGLYVSYRFAPKSEQADKLETKLLLEKILDQWRHRVNLTFEKAFGGDSEEKWEGGASSSSTYRVNRAFEPGAEIHWEYGELDVGRSFDEQQFQLGPVVYGRIGRHLKYDVGYLFGISDAAPAGELKWIFEFEWRL